MKPSTKLHISCAGYCALLASLNWFRSVEYSGTGGGLKSESVSAVGGALLISGAFALYLASHCLRAARRRLETRSKVQTGNWIQSWSVFAYALPLLWHQQATSVWREADGVMATATQGYGHALSTWVFVFAVIGMLLFQILLRLSDDRNDPQSGSSTTFSSHRAASC